MPKLKNIIIFLVIGALVVLAYFFFFKESSETENLVSSPGQTSPLSASVAGEVAEAKDFLTLLLSVKNIKLDDAVLSDIAFTSLDGSNSIILVSDGNEGRPNPFAPFGTDAVAPPPTSGAGSDLDIDTTLP